MVNPVENNQSEHEKCILEFLGDTETRELMIQKLDHVARNLLGGEAGVFNLPLSSNMFLSTNSSTSPWPMFPFPIAMPFPECWVPAVSTTPTSVGTVPL